MNKIKESFKQLLDGEKPNFALWIFLIGGLLVLILLPFLLTRNWLVDYVDYTSTGQVGDTIGGIAGPIIALIAALLTFFAFWAQYKANLAQTKQFSEQDKDTKIDRFENKFYELLRLHKENVNEISIDGYDQRKVTNRKAFVSMYKELRHAFFVAKLEHEKLKNSNKLAKEYKDEELLRLAYILFYAGVGLHSDEMNKAMAGDLSKTELYKEVSKHLMDIQKDHKKNSLKDELTELEIDGLGKSKTPYTYRPFVGHLSRFGHYYRHLFQTVKFVVNQDDNLISEDQKLEYLRTLRAQLSDHEQAMIYYNAVAGFGETVANFGKAWIDNGYFTKYKMIHNLPLPLADFGIMPQEKFKNEIKNGDDIFEWLPKQQK